MFSGIEAASVAAAGLDWEFCAFAEPDPRAAAVIHAHHGCGAPVFELPPRGRLARLALPARLPDAPINWGDITQVDWSRYNGSVDLVVGGPPCQAFSLSGLRRSLADDRGNLSLSYMKAIHAIGPDWCLAENVPGWLDTPDNAFGCFLGGLVGASAALEPPADGRWGRAGMVDGPLYRIAWRTLSARGFVPQRRRRVFVLAARVGSGGDPGRVLFDAAADVGRHPGDGARCRSIPRVSSGSGRDIAACRASAGEAGPTPGSCVAGVGGPPSPARRTGTQDWDGSAPGAFTANDYAADFGDTSPPLRSGNHVRARPNGGIAIAAVLPVSDGFVIRRLTPVEWCRLQGFPDDYLDHALLAGRKLANNARYAVLGNSWAVPVVRWIFQRLDTEIRCQSAP